VIYNEEYDAITKCEVVFIPEYTADPVMDKFLAALGSIFPEFKEIDVLITLVLGQRDADKNTSDYVRIWNQVQTEHDRYFRKFTPKVKETSHPWYRQFSAEDCNQRIKILVSIGSQ
jgi:hypothetical protein